MPVVYARHAMTPSTGRWALLAAGAAEAGGQQSLTLAIIAGSFVFASSVLGPLVTEWFRQRKRRPPTDHHAEMSVEQNQLFTHLLNELAERDEERADLHTQVTKLRAENARLRARRRA
jgi:hypothetical protein